MEITITPFSSNEVTQIENLLWEILWKPIGFSKDVRKKFRPENYEDEIILTAKAHDDNIGIIVAYQISKDEYEIRHIAVRHEYQKSGIGKKLVNKLQTILKEKGIKKIQTISRNTSKVFFKTIGFEKVEHYPDHPDFLKHGISFTLMRKTIQSPL